MAERDKSNSIKNDPKSFEEAFRELELGVRNLEKGNLGLEESLSQFEGAIASLRFCLKQLEQAKRRVELLQGVSEEGSAETTPFEDDSMNLDEKQVSRSRRRSSGTGGDSTKPKRLSDVD